MDFDICNKCLNKINTIYLIQENNCLEIFIFHDNMKNVERCYLKTTKINDKKFFKTFCIDTGIYPKIDNKILVCERKLKDYELIKQYEIYYDEFINFYFNKIKCCKQCKYFAEQTMKEIYKEKK